MQQISRVIIATLAVIAFLPFTCKAETNYVFIDQSSKAFRTYVNVPADSVDEIRSEAERQPGVAVVSWDQFIKDKQGYLADAVVKDEYPGSSAVEGIIQILERYPGVPIGLTWNGGVAFTASDYQHAERAYQNYMENPDAYEQSRNKDPRADPVRPEHHLGPLLGK